MNSLCLATMGPVDEAVISTVEIALWQVFGFEVERGDPLPLPGDAYDIKRKQYSSVPFLRELSKMRRNGQVRILGITEADLFIPMLSFVFGHAQLNGSAAVMSLARLHQEFYRLRERREVLLDRAVKEAVHEMGHTFGLVHCDDQRCAMSLSNTIQLVDNKSGTLCRECGIRLQQTLTHLFPVTGVERQQ